MGSKKKTGDNIAQQEAEIIARLDILAEYAAMGVNVVGQVRSSGIAECYSAFRDESKPSSWISTENGKYGDSGSGEKPLSLWDFAARKGLFPDWRAARQHFADKAGVALSAGGKPKASPLDALEFLPWSDGHDRLAHIWCVKHKQGASLEAIKLAGGKVGYYPCWTDKEGNRHRGEYKIIALPCWNHNLPPAPPCAWVIWNIGGGPLPVRRGKDIPPDWVKMKSVGETRGTMMNLHALQVLADAEKSASVELIYKTGGPSDMLAIFAAILRDSRERMDRHLVLTNASSETGDVLPHQVALFAGHKAALIGDADEAGIAGVMKWQQALAGVASELRCPTLPYVVQKKHGKDARDFLNGVPSDLLQVT